MTESEVGDRECWTLEETRGLHRRDRETMESIPYRSREFLLSQALDRRPHSDRLGEDTHCGLHSVFQHPWIYRPS
jgi:hypothetical protein